MFHPGAAELGIIMVIVFIIFGAGKLPQLGDGLGKAIRNFRSGIKDPPKEIDGPAQSDIHEATSKKGGDNLISDNTVEARR
ncbi:MAG: twin-arginine translocase TatA/TatE family subunit [Desulfobacterales bacterium]|nr:MAG: twin-arginine translocase TatA/TatE family subunit [Desulfobacterales bacterium]